MSLHNGHRGPSCSPSPQQWGHSACIRLRIVFCKPGMEAGSRPAGKKRENGMAAMARSAASSCGRHTEPLSRSFRLFCQASERNAAKRSEIGRESRCGCRDSQKVDEHYDCPESILDQFPPLPAQHTIRRLQTLSRFAIAGSPFVLQNFNNPENPNKSTPMTNELNAICSSFSVQPGPFAKQATSRQRLSGPVMHTFHFRDRSPAWPPRARACRCPPTPPWP